MTAGSVQVAVAADVVEVLRPEAIRRGVTTNELVRRVLAAVSYDGLVGAVLDDGVTASGSEKSRSRLRLEYAEARIEELESLLLPEAAPVPLSLRLPRREEQILRALLTRPVVSGESLLVLLYGPMPEVDVNTIQSHVSKLRAKLVAHGIAIKSARFQGYRIEDRAAAAEKLRALCLQEAPRFAVAAE